MNKLSIFFFGFLVSSVIIPNLPFADSQIANQNQIITPKAVTIRYADHSITNNTDGTFTAVFGLPTRLNDGTGHFDKPYFITPFINGTIISTGLGTYVYNQNTCSIKLYKPELVANDRDAIVSSLSLTLQQTDILNGTWNMSTINLATCNTSQQDFGSYYSINATRQNANGIWTTTYTFATDKPMEYSSTFIALSSMAHYYIITESEFGISNKLTFGLSQVTINSTIPIQITNQIKLIKSIRYNDFNTVYNFGNSINSLYKTQAFKNINGIVNLSNDFASSQPLSNGQSFSIDPILGYFSGKLFSLTTGNSGASSTCPNTWTTGTLDRLRLPTSGSAFDSCGMASIQFATNGINPTATISQVNYKYDVTQNSNGRTCDFKKIADKPSTASNSVLANDIMNGTTYVSGDIGCKTVSTGNVISLGSTAATDLQNQLSAQWFAVGIRLTNMTRDASLYDPIMANEQLQVTYTSTSPDAPYQTNSTEANIPTYKWSTPQNNGLAINAYKANIWNGSQFISYITNQTTLNFTGNQVGANLTQKIQLIAHNTAGWSSGYAFPVNTTVSNAEQMHIPFDYNMHDAGKLRNDGSISVGTENYTTGHNGAALILDGSSNATFPNQNGITFTNATAFTLESWIKTSSSSTQTILSKFTNAGVGYALRTISGKASILLQSSSSSYIRTDGAISINNNAWHNVIATYGGTGKLSGTHIYIDGVLDTVNNSHDTLTSSISNSQQLSIGSLSNGTAKFNGQIDDLHIFSIALNQQEVTDIDNEQITQVPVIPVLSTTTTVFNATIVNLTWTEGNNGGTAITNYNIQRSTNNGLTWGTVKSANFPGKAYTDTGLFSGITYCYRLLATNIIGNGTYSGQSCATTSAPVVINATNPIIQPITFQRINKNATTVLLNVTRPSTYDLTCNFAYLFPTLNNTYNHLVNRTSPTAGNVYTNFTFTNASNAIVTVNCMDIKTKTNGTYLITQQNATIPLISQIKNFRTGAYGTHGAFGALDMVTLLVIIISMIGLNRVSESVGSVFMLFIIGGLAIFGIITFPVVIFSAVALILMVVVVSTRKLAYS